MRSLIKFLSGVEFPELSLDFPTFEEIKSMENKGKVIEGLEETHEGTKKTISFESEDGSVKMYRSEFVSKGYEGQEGKTKEEKLKDAQKLLDAAIKNQEFEKAAKYRDVIALLK